MLRLAIIEDEPKTRSFLISLVKDQLPDIEVVGEADSVKSGLKLINSKKPDAILLDVEMGDGNGFDLLEQLTDFRPHVIFVTAYDHYAVQALRIDAVDYIEKPVNPDELKAGLEKIAGLVEQQVAPSYDKMLHALRPEIANKIGVPSRSGLIYINVSEIVYLQADGAYTQLVVENRDKPLIISKTLKEVQPSLQPLGFLRLHRSYLVNTAKIEELNKTDGGFVVMSTGQSIPFSKQYRKGSMDRIREMTTFL